MENTSKSEATNNRIDPLLVEESINYPRFKLLVKKEVTEEEILKEIKRELKDLETILNATFRLTKQEALPMNSLHIAEDQTTVKQDMIEQEKKTRLTKTRPLPHTSIARTKYSCSAMRSWFCQPMWKGKT